MLYLLEDREEEINATIYMCTEYCYSVQGELGEDYVLYLLEDQEEKPVAVVLPKDAAEQPLPAAQEVLPAAQLPFASGSAQLFPKRMLKGV